MVRRSRWFNPKIVVSRFDRVVDEEVDGIVKVMEECYHRLTPHNVTLVDLYVFDRSSSLEAFLAKESSEVGVASAPFDELFFAMHDAWRGTPRITICFERMRGLPKLVQMGGIHHEVGHSVLHGGLSYYFLSFPPGLLALVKRLDFSMDYATNLLYLISIAVKDYEVTRILHERGYVEDQVAYAKQLLTVSEDDLLAWRMAQGKPLAEILCLTSGLKAPACAVPLLLDKTYGKEMNSCLKESLSYLPPDYSSLLLKVLSEDFPRLGTDTLENIAHMTDLIAERIIKPLLGG
ncbi:MAG: hypothetical protein QW231_02755 [Candidatus Bathyarchaeia archaeon]